MIYKHETKLFTISAIIAALFWLLIILGTVGIALIYLVFGFIFYLFVQSGFISYIKGTGVELSAEQYPDLYEKFTACCQKLQMDEIPHIYIINSDGILNALATKFLRHHYVVLYSDIVDALERYPNGLKFYIGHELGHIKRRHLKFAFFLWPASIIPILGSAYFRAREYSCDLHGLACCDEIKDAAFALAVLAAGPTQWSKLNVNSYVGQCDQTGQFWMSFHEYTGDYPWLCKRMKHLVAVGKNESPIFPRRSIFAFIIALFCPRLGPGGGIGSLFVTIIIIGVLAAVALPAYQDYLSRAKMASVEPLMEQVQYAAESYIMENDSLPYDLQLIGLPADLGNEAVATVQVTEEGFEFQLTGGKEFEGHTILLRPRLHEGELYWDCTGGTLKESLLPHYCK